MHTFQNDHFIKIIILPSAQEAVTHIIQKVTIENGSLLLGHTVYSLLPIGLQHSGTEAWRLLRARSISVEQHQHQEIHEHAQHTEQCSLSLFSSLSLFIALSVHHQLLSLFLSLSITEQCVSLYISFSLLSIFSPFSLSVFFFLSSFFLLLSLSPSFFITSDKESDNDKDPNDESSEGSRYNIHCKVYQHDQIRLQSKTLKYL